jgi:hypothetical protein
VASPAPRGEGERDGDGGMTAHRIGLAILAAIAVALGVVHAVAGGRAGPRSRAIFHERVSGATALRWDSPEGGSLAIEKRGDAWHMIAPSAGPVDPAAVADVLGALRGARWQRVADAAPGPARRTLAVGADTLELGPDVPGVGGWVRGGRRWYLVEPWVIAALDRDALSLRPRLPFATAVAGLQRMIVKGDRVDVELVGAPLGVETPDGRARLAPDVATTVVGHVAAIHVEELVHGDPQPRPVLLTIGVDGARGPVAVEVRGPCPGDPALVWIGGASTGEVCVAQAPVLAFEAAVRAIAAAPLTYVDPRVAPGPYETITLLSGATLAWQGAVVTVDGRPADDEAIARVVAALEAPATPTLAPAPRPATRGAITVDGRRLELVAGDVLVPTDTRYGHHLEPEVLAVLRLGVDDLRDRVVLRTEPSLLTGLAIAEGGATREVPADAAWAKEVAEAVREIRVDGFLAGAPPAPRRTIELTYAPPPTAGAQPEQHRILLGANQRSGCAATVDGEGVLLPRALCVLLGKPAPP